MADRASELTVQGILDQDCLGWFMIDIEEHGETLLAAGLADGDRVEVTIRKQELEQSKDE